MQISVVKRISSDRINKFTVNYSFKNISWDFTGGTVVKNPPASAGYMGSIPGPGRSHMPQSN